MSAACSLALYDSHGVRPSELCDPPEHPTNATPAATAAKAITIRRLAFIAVPPDPRYPQCATAPHTAAERDVRPEQGPSGASTRRRPMAPVAAVDSAHDRFCTSSR